MEARNRKATFDVQVEQTYEAGIVLEGSEIKSIRANRAQLSGGYVKLLHRGGDRLPEVVLVGLHLAGARDPERVRRLLLHEKEIAQLDGLLSAKGKVAVPLKIYLTHGWAKLQIGLGRGRKMHDKRELLRDRDRDREQQQELKVRR